MEKKYKELFVKELLKDEKDNPLIVLESSDKVILPIAIGHSEAFSIALALENKKFDRPLTHDLLKNVIIGFNSKVIRLLITALKNGTFYAKLRIERMDIENNQTKILEIDCRPSDGIAVAIRFNAPVFALNSVLQSGGQTFSDSENL